MIIANKEKENFNLQVDQNNANNSVDLLDKDNINAIPSPI